MWWIASAETTAVYLPRGFHDAKSDRTNDARGCPQSVFLRCRAFCRRCLQAPIRRREISARQTPRVFPCPRRGRLPARSRGVRARPPPRRRIRRNRESGFGVANRTAPKFLQTAPLRPCPPTKPNAARSATKFGLRFFCRGRRLCKFPRVEKIRSATSRLPRAVLRNEPRIRCRKI